MDRRTRPDIARSRIACALALALCAAGCGGNSYVAYSSGGSGTTNVPNGTGFTAYTSSSSSGYFVLGMIGILLYDNERWHESLMRYGTVPVPTPPLDVTRKVNEQDCSKPIEDTSANLKCR